MILTTPDLSFINQLRVKAHGVVTAALDRVRDCPTDKATVTTEDLEQWEAYELGNLLDACHLQTFYLRDHAPHKRDFQNAVVTLRHLWRRYQERITEQEAALAEAQDDEAPASGFVYFIQCGAFVKIGYTADVASRFATIATSAPERPVLLHSFRGVRADERYLHSRFASLRSHREWFRLEGALEAYLKELGG